MKSDLEEYRFVYICHPIKGDSQFSYEENIEEVKRISREISLSQRGVVPITPVLASIQYLNDFNEEERNIGIEHDLAIIDLLCSAKNAAIFVYGHKISEGMRKEISRAKGKLPIIAKDERIKRDLEKIIGG